VKIWKDVIFLMFIATTLHAESQKVEIKTYTGDQLKIGAFPIGYSEDHDELNIICGFLTGKLGSQEQGSGHEPVLGKEDPKYPGYYLDRSYLTYALASTGARSHFELLLKSDRGFEQLTYLKCVSPL